jgi:hypothetical protein
MAAFVSGVLQRPRLRPSAELARRHGRLRSSTCAAVGGRGAPPPVPALSWPRGSAGERYRQAQVVGGYRDREEDRIDVNGQGAKQSFPYVGPTHQNDGTVKF